MNQGIKLNGVFILYPNYPILAYLFKTFYENISTIDNSIIQRPGATVGLQEEVNLKSYSRQT